METTNKAITVEASVNAPIEKVWNLWGSPEHITKWCNASEDWHTPVAENDLRTGGKFFSRMEAKDGSFGFDFGGVYDEVKKNELIAYTLGDGRKVKITFAPSASGTKIIETFDPESTNPVEMQKTGWQAILNNFKKYAEANELKTDDSPIVVERIFNAPASKVWKAITDKNEMKKWYFDLAEFKPEKGFKFQFMGGTENKQYLHLCEITEAVPGKKLAHTWVYDGYEGSSLVSFELFEEGEKTRLKLTHKGLETFPKENPDFAKANFVEGWNHIVNVSLKDYLEGSRK